MQCQVCKIQKQSWSFFWVINSFQMERIYMQYIWKILLQLFQCLNLHILYPWNGIKSNELSQPFSYLHTIQYDTKLRLKAGKELAQSLQQCQQSSNFIKQDTNLTMYFRKLNGLELVHLLVIEHLIFGFEYTDIQHGNK